MDNLVEWDVELLSIKSTCFTNISIAILCFKQANRMIVSYQDKINFPLFPVTEIPDFKIPQAGFCHSCRHTYKADCHKVFKNNSKFRFSAFVLQMTNCK